MLCRLCRHPSGDHEHFSSRTHCSRQLPDGSWCRCGAFEGPATVLWDVWAWLVEHWPRRYR